MGSIVFVAFLVAVFGALVWFSARAKPIGPVPFQKPYRWGTYIALTTLLCSTTFLLSAGEAVSNGNMGGAVAVSALFFLCAATGVMLLLRKRLGVVLFFLSYLAILGAQPHHNGLTSQAQETGGFTIYSAITGWYLVKRWRLYDNTTSEEVITKRSPRFDTVTGKQNW